MASFSYKTQRPKSLKRVEDLFVTVHNLSGPLKQDPMGLISFVLKPI